MRNILSNPYLKMALAMVAVFLLFQVPLLADEPSNLLGDFLTTSRDALKDKIKGITNLIIGVFLIVGIIICAVQFAKMQGGDPNAKDALKTTAIATIIFLAIVYIFGKLASTALTNVN